MKWLVLASGALADRAASRRRTVVGDADPVHVIPALVVTAWPIAICVAILRYRLYDVDLVISRTFTYATLTVLLAAVYGVAVIILGAVIGRESVWAAAGATLLAATVFKLLHRRVQHLVDRRFRPQHHDALGIVTRFVDDLRHGRVEPEDVTAALRAAMRDPSLELRFVLQSNEPPVDERGWPAAVVSDGRESVPVLRGGTPLGQVVWSARDDADRGLLTSVIDAASIAIEMARLRVELRQRLVEVDESRARIAAVADRNEGVSNATCTTALNSGWSLSASRCGTHSTSYLGIRSKLAQH